MVSVHAFFFAADVLVLFDASEGFASSAAQARMGVSIFEGEFEDDVGRAVNVRAGV